MNLFGRHIQFIWWHPSWVQLGERRWLYEEVEHCSYCFGLFEIRIWNAGVQPVKTFLGRGDK